MGAASERRFGLDLARAVAIGLVVAAHGLFLVPVEQPGLTDKLHRLGGFFGVDLFFVLSGLLIGGILMDQLDAARDDVPLSRRLGTFWLRRWFRTLPNYYLFLALSVVIGGATWSDARYLLFLQNVGGPVAGRMPESWSLAIEEWFYVTFPLVLAGTMLVLPLSRRAALLAGTLGYVALFAGVRLLAARAGWCNDNMRFVLTMRLDAIGYGVLVAWAMHHHPARVARAAGACLVAGVLLVALSVEWLLVGDLRTPTLASTALFPLTSAGLALCMPWLAALRSPGPWLRRPVEHVSVISYSAYLSHFSVVLPLVARFVPADRPGVRVAAYALTTLVLSTLVYHLFERRMTGLRERFSPSRATTTS